MKLLLSVVTVCLLVTNLCSAQNCAPAPSGLVGWWRAEGNTFDVQSGNFGTLMGNTTFGTGRVGQAFVFDGSGDGVALGNPTNLQMQNFTIEAWVRRSSTSQASLDPYNSGCIFCCTWGGYGFVMHDNGQLFLTKVGYNEVNSSLAITDTNSFHHVAVTKTGSTVVFYLDGVAETVGPYDPGFLFGGPAAIGARGDDMVASFLGSIDEVSVYNRVLSNNEIQAIYTAGSTGKCLPAPPIIPTNGLIAYYPFNGNADDASGNGNDGIQTGVTQTVDRFGTGGFAYQFNGSNSVIAVAPLSSANLPELTVSMWVYPSALPTGTAGQFINKWRGYSYSLEDYQMGLRNDLRIEFGNGRHGAGYFESPNHCLITTTSQLSVGQWYHIVASLDSAGTGKVWVNGGLWAQDNILPLLPPASEPVRIGQALLAASPPFNGAIADTFIGMIDDVRIYDRALSGAEILQLYSQASVAPPQITQQPHGTVGYWGGNALFGVGANGTAPLSYQWYKESFPISWGTNSTLTLTNIDFTDAGNYSVTITNAYGSTNSTQALLVVNPSGVRLGIHPFLSITGTVGKAFGIQSTTEISQTNSWTTLTNFTLTSPVQEWVDQSVDVTVSPRRFYRVVPLPNQ